MKVNLLGIIIISVILGFIYAISSAYLYILLPDKILSCVGTPQDTLNGYMLDKGYLWTEQAIEISLLAIGLIMCIFFTKKAYHFLFYVPIVKLVRYIGLAVMLHAPYMSSFDMVCFTPQVFTVSVGAEIAVCFAAIVLGALIYVLDEAKVRDSKKSDTGDGTAKSFEKKQKGTKKKTKKQDKEQD